METSIYHGPATLELEGSELVIGPKGSLDSYTCRIATAYPGWKAALSAAGWTYGQQVPESLAMHSMWVSDLRVTAASSARATISISCLGLCEDYTKLKVNHSSAANSISFGPVPTSVMAESETAVPDKWRRRVFDKSTSTWVLRTKWPIILEEGHPAWSVMQGIPTVTHTWFTTVPVDGVINGTSIDPFSGEAAICGLGSGQGEDFSGSDYAWLDFRRNHPSGWVVQSSSSECLFAMPAAGPIPAYGLWANTRSMIYNPAQTPM